MGARDLAAEAGQKSTHLARVRGVSRAEAFGEDALFEASSQELRRTEQQGADDERGRRSERHGEPQDFAHGGEIHGMPNEAIRSGPHELVRCLGAVELNGPASTEPSQRSRAKRQTENEEQHAGDRR